MYWAVQSPRPGYCRSRRDGGVGIGPGWRSSSRRATARAMATDRRGPRRGDAQRRQLAVVGIGQALGVGAEPVQAGERRLDRLAEPTGEPAGERRGRSHRDPLAQDRPHRQLEAVEGARDPQARQPVDGPGDPRVPAQVVGDHVRPRRQVEEVLEPGEDLGQGRRRGPVASSTASAFRPAIGSTFSQPRCGPTAAVRR